MVEEARWVFLCRARPLAAAVVGTDQRVLVGPGGGGGPARQAELHEDVVDVAGDGLLADAKLGGNRAVGAAARDETQHLPPRAG